MFRNFNVQQPEMAVGTTAEHALGLRQLLLQRNKRGEEEKTEVQLHIV